MPASKAQQRAVSKYMKENYDEIKVRMEKGQKRHYQGPRRGPWGERKRLCESGHSGDYGAGQRRSCGAK